MAIPPAQVEAPRPAPAPPAPASDANRAEPAAARTPFARSSRSIGPDQTQIPGDPDPQARRAWLTLICGGGLALRALILVIGPYQAPARAAVADPAAGPGYAMVLQLLELGGVPTWAWLAVQCAVSALTPLLVFGLALTLLQRTGPALVAAGVFAFHPASIAAANALSHEAWLTALLLLGLYAALGVRPMRADAAGLGGIAFGVGWLLRPMSLMLGPLVGLWMLIHRRRKHTVLASAMFIAGTGVAPLGWHAYGLYYDRPEAGPLVAAPATDFWRGGELAGQLLIAPGADRLTRQLGIPYAGDSLAERFVRGDATLAGEPDAVPAALATGWVGLNVAILFGSLAAIPVLAARRRYMLTALLGGLAIGLTMTALPGTAEPLRLPALAIQGILIATLAIPADPRPTPATSKRQARRQRRRQQKQDPYDFAALEADAAEPVPALKAGRLI